MNDSILKEHSRNPLDPYKIKALQKLWENQGNNMVSKHFSKCDINIEASDTLLGNRNIYNSGNINIENTVFCEKFE